MRETDYDDTQLYEVLWNLKGQVFALQAIIGMVLRRVAENGNTKDAIIAEIRMVMHDVRTARTDDTPFPPGAAALEQGTLHYLESLLGLLVTEHDDTSPINDDSFSL